MSITLDPMLILFYALGLVVLFFAGKLLLAPFKLILRFLFNSLLGAVVIIVINLIGSAFSFSIPLNPLNAVLTGVFGVPGVLLIFIIRLIFMH